MIRHQEYNWEKIKEEKEAPKEKQRSPHILIEQQVGILHRRCRFWDETI
jgi:hypothetical protein